MQNELFEHFYPMPDDIAQSILISETETNIHLRPTNLNAKKVWLYNKLLKNLLTNRKTLIHLESQTDYTIITEFLEDLGLDKLCFSFTHSRSNNEKKLKEFEPIIVNGIINPDAFTTSLKNLRNTYSELLSSYKAFYQKDPVSQDNLSGYIQNSIRIRQSLYPLEGFQATISNLSQKDILSLKRNLKDLIELSKGSNPLLVPFQVIHKNIFDMFSEEEAWSALSEHLEYLKANALPILRSIQLFKEHFIEEFICSTQKIILPSFDLFIGLNAKDILNAEEEIQFSLITSKLIHSISSISFDISLLQIENLRKLSSAQLLRLIVDRAHHNWNIASSESIAPETQIPLYNEIVFEATTLIYKLNHQGVFTPRTFNNQSIQQIKFFLLELRKETELLISLKPYFSLFYNWKKYLLNCTENQQHFIQDLTALPTSYWHLLLDLCHTEKHIEQSYLFDAKALEERSINFSSSFEEYKKELIHFLAAKYELQQHKQLKEISKNQPELKQLVLDRENSELSLSEYYSKLPILSELFPILILENTKPDYFPSTTNKVWDEIILLNNNNANQNLSKMFSSAFHVIHLHTAHSSEAVFNIALTQSTPEKLKNILFETHHSESFSTIQQLSNFIFSNQSKFTILINSEDFIISFLPLNLTKLLLNLLPEEYNVFSISEEKDFERFNDWLMYKPTNKKIWTIDQLINSELLSLQQLSWQKHFLKSLKFAGFEIENFSSEILLNIRNIWKFPNKHSFYYNNIVTTTQVHA